MSKRDNDFMTPMDQTRAATRRVFTSRDGQVLLEHLEKLYYDCPFKPQDLERQVGRRDVVLHLHALLREDNA